LLSITNRDREARIRIQDLWQYDTGVRPLRDELFKRLAVDADALASWLRREYRVPQRREGAWGPGDELKNWETEVAAAG